MTITLPPDLAAAVTELAQKSGRTPESLALDALRLRFDPKLQPRDEWERRLFGAATDCGVSIPDEALSSDGLYE